MKKLCLFLMVLIVPGFVSAAEKSPYKTRVEAGFNLESGNSDQEDYKLKTTLDYQGDKWGYRVSASLENEMENDKRTDEEYKIDFQSRYTLSPRSYAFAEVGFDYDRFSGVDRRFSEAVGYGYKLYDQKDLSVSVEGAIGAQQVREAKKNNASKFKYNNAFLSEAGLRAKWQINKNVTFEQEIKSQFTSDLTTLETESALLTKLSERLFFKLGWEVERLSDVPVGKKNTDTKTSLTLVYDF